MTQPIAPVAFVPPARAPAVTPAPASQPDFLHSINRALEQVSAAQASSGAQNHALIQGAPGASLEKAVVASARARIDWTATVAVRNEVVNAYRTIMNMPV